MLAAYYTTTGTTIAGVAILFIVGACLMFWAWWPRSRQPGSRRDRYYRFPIYRIREGDLVDLAGDPYADPSSDPNALTAFEHFRVGEIVEETPDCTVIHFDQGSFGFPPHHRLRVLRED